MAKPPTIKDVARKAGFSLATVSRVINRSGYFDEATARAVRDAVASLGYRRNVHWRRLAAQSSRTLCFLLGNRAALNSMQMKMLVACERTAHENGYDLVFTRFEYPLDGKARNLALPRMLAERGLVDGVILIGRQAGNLLGALDLAAMPWVLLGNTYEGDFHALTENTVSYDDESGCYEAASYLARLGHRRIAFVGNAAQPWFRRRHAGYLRALRRHGLKPLSIVDDWDVSGIDYGRLAAAPLMRFSEPPTAVLASNDEVAAGVWKELIHRGVRIPRDISLCGFGDREEFQILEPSLTSMAVFPDKLGAELARMLLERLAGPGGAVPSRTWPCQLVERSSCAPPRSRLKAVKP